MDILRLTVERKKISVLSVPVHINIQTARTWIVKSVQIVAMPIVQECPKFLAAKQLTYHAAVNHLSYRDALIQIRKRNV